MTELLRRMWADDQGQDLIEYALICVLIALAVFALLGTVGQTINGIWGRIVTALTSA